MKEAEISLKKSGLTPFIGNQSPDLEMMRTAGLADALCFSELIDDSEIRLVTFA